MSLNSGPTLRTYLGTLRTYLGTLPTYVRTLEHGVPVIHAIFPSIPSHTVAIGIIFIGIV